jgi:hypothetical protein
MGRTRKAPDISANAVSPGAIKRGNDGNMYRACRYVNKNGTKYNRWVRVRKMHRADESEDGYSTGELRKMEMEDRLMGWGGGKPRKRTSVLRKRPGDPGIRSRKSRRRAGSRRRGNSRTRSRKTGKNHVAARKRRSRR